MTRHLSRIVSRALLILALIGLASPAVAQDDPIPEETPPVEDLGPAEEITDEDPPLEDEEAVDLEGLSSLLGESVVTTASRGAERASSAPAAIFTITAAEMRTYGIRTVDEALVFLGIGVQTTRVRDYLGGGDVGAQGLMLRDVGRHVLVLLDGQVMNAQDTGASQVNESLGVPLEAIDHIEVVLGAGSVMYGSNAMLAVVHIFTRRAGDDPGIHVTAELGVSPPTSVDGQPTTPTSPGDRVGIRYRFGLGFGRTFRLLGSDAELTVRTEWLEEISNSYGTPVLPGGTLQTTPGETTWGGAAVHSMQAPSLVAALRVGDFRLQIQASHYQRGMPLVGTFDDPRASEERNFLRIDLRHSALLDAHVSLTTRLYGGVSDWSETSIWTSPYWCVPGQIDGCSYRGRSRGRWAGLEQQLAIDWNLDGALVTTVGYDVRGRDATSRSADYYDRLTGEAPATTRLPYAHTVSALGAVFAQQVWQPIEWLVMNGGARLDIDSLFGARVSPRVAATFLPIDGTSIRLSYAEAFRAPTAYELTEVDPTYRAPAPGLQPEIARTGELEWQQRIAWLSFSLRGFVSFYEGFIDNRSVTGPEFATALGNGNIASTAELANVIRWDNLGTLRTIGGSLSFTLRPTEGLSLGGSLTITDTRRDEILIPLVPLWMGNARIAYTFAPDGATLALATTFAGRRIAYADFETLATTEAGEQLDLRATFTSPLDAVPGLSMRVSFSYSVNPFLPYLLEAPNPDEPNARTTLTPTPSTFFGFMGLQYDLDP
jgi:outer membrane receptor for ferrienterochelin and colicins